MELSPAQKAVAAALSGDWKKAVTLNQEVLKVNPKDIDALNRLARAYAELGHVKKAKTETQKALKIDPFNKIATASLLKWNQLKGKSAPTLLATSAEAFLEEPGKTILINLLHPGPGNILAKLDCGDEVKLAPHTHRVNVTTSDDKYVGRLPDDLSARLRRLMKVGNQYNAIVKSVDKSDVKIIIREVFRSKEAGNVPSFPSEKIDYIAFTPPELVHKKEEVVEAMREEESG